MRTPWFRTIALWGSLLVVATASPAAAAGPPMDTPRRSATDEMPPVGEGPVKEAQPPVLFLRNKDGGLLQAVLGFTLEDFERFMAQRAQLGLGQQPPRFQFERLIATGQADERHAEFSIEVTVVVNQPGWVRIPLRMSEAVMRAKPRYQGPGEYRVEFEGNGKEHVLWLRGEGEQPHRVALDMAVPLEKVAEQSELKLGLPRAAVSELTFTVPDPLAVATVGEGGLLDSTSHSKNATEFKILGMERDFALTWQKENTAAAETATPIEAAGVLDTRVESSGVHTDVQLTVRTFGSKLDSFRMKVPAGVTLTPVEQPGYTIEPVKNGTPSGEAHQPQSYEVRLRDKGAVPAAIRFSLDQPLDERSDQRDFELTGVDIVGAARQSGYVAVRVADDSQIEWGELRQVRQVDEYPAEVDREGVLASFEYFGKPFSLAGRLLPLKMHTSVQPHYTVEIDGQRVRLEARLTYQVRGAKVFAIEVAMPGWVLDDVAPRSTFDVDRVAVEGNRPLRVPLLQAATGEIELQLRAHQDLASAVTQTVFDLPQPVADATAPVQLVVVPAENVSLSVREPELVGLTRLRGDAPADGSRDITFRGQTGELHFAADLQIETRTVAANIYSRLKIDRSSANVEETIEYTIVNEPLSELLLDVPTWLATADRIQWRLDDRPVTPTSDGNESRIERTSRFRVTLPEKRQGKCRLSLEYPLRFDALAAGTDLPIDVPLVMPAVTELTANELTVIATPDLRVEQRDSGWNVESLPTDGKQPVSLWLTSPLASTEVALSARLKETPAVEPTVVERAWIQTRLARGERWDRAVFRLKGSPKQVTLRLPTGALAADAQAVVDGAPVITLNVARDTLSFELNPKRNEHVLDVSYRFATHGVDDGRFHLAPPIIEGGPWVRQTYWQLVVPRDEHLFDWPADLTGVFHWQFTNGLWARQPLVEQSRLEAWTNATAGPEVPEQANRYVLTALGPIDELNVYLINRLTLVVLTSGGVLAAGLLLLYFKSLRHPALLFVAGVALTAGALAYPETAVLLAQVAVLGAALVLLAALLDRYFSSRRRSPLVIRTNPSSVLEPGSTRTHLRVQASSSSGEPIPRIPQATASTGES